VEKEKQRKETEEIVNRIREDQERRKVAREKRKAEELALILYLC
jgi:hypothetical protein